MGGHGKHVLGSPGDQLPRRLGDITGIYTIRRFTAWGHRDTAYFMCFAAGVLISASFLHIIPKAFSMRPQADFQNYREHS